MSEVNSDQDDFDAGWENAPTTTPDAQDDQPDEREVVQQKYAQITEEQFADLQRRAAALDELKSESARKFDHAFGQLGGLKQVMERLQSQTPAGQSIQVSDDDFSELKSEFPELAEMQIKGLNRALSRTKGTASVDMSMVEKLVQERTADARADALDSLHNIIPDWQEAVRTPEYRQWIAQQPGDIRTLENSDKVRDAARLLRAFSKYKPPTQAAAKPTPVSTRQRQLEAAVNPRSSGGVSTGASDDDEFDSGFNGR